MEANGGPIPIPCMYGILTYIYYKFKPNVGKYPIHGSYGINMFFKITPGSDMTQELGKVKTMEKRLEVLWFQQWLALQIYSISPHSMSCVCVCSSRFKEFGKKLQYHQYLLFENRISSLSFLVKFLYQILSSNLTNSPSQRPHYLWPSPYLRGFWEHVHTPRRPEAGGVTRPCSELWKPTSYKKKTETKWPKRYGIHPWRLTFCT